MPASTLTRARARVLTLARLHALLTAQSLILLLFALNRLGPWTAGYVAPNEFLRWVDFNNLLVLPLASLVATYLLKKQLEYAGPQRDGRRHLLVNLAFFVGVYLLGASYGDHEITNYLSTRFCPAGDASDLCRIVTFNDDQFSHWLFFVGYALINGALMLLQVLFPHQGTPTGADRALLVANGLLIALGTFANLAFSQLGLDLYVVALLALLAVGLLGRHGAQPLLVYYATAYPVGLAATTLYQLLA